MVGFEHPGAFKIPGRSIAPRFYHAADPVNGHDIAKNFSGDFCFPSTSVPTRLRLPSLQTVLVVVTDHSILRTAMVC